MSSRRFVLGWKKLGHERRLKAYIINYADLEGIVAKRKYDPYLPGTKWLKIRNPNYS